ncbi:MAG: sulfatase [Planctomycetota bacterium]|jgi:arylsulfatase A-like enzyme
MLPPLRTAARRRTPLALLASAALVAAGCAPAAPVEPDAPRNAILISLDTLRSDHVGFYGYERDTTPFLDELAGEAVVFDQAYSTSAWTLISHASMLSGVEPEIHGVIEARYAFSPGLPLLAERLQAIGVQTFGTYFKGWISEQRGFQRGFDYFKPAYNAEVADARLLEIEELRDPERPAFLFVHLFDIHSAAFKPGERGPVYQPPAPYDEFFQKGARALFADSNPAKVWEDEEPLNAAQIEALGALYDGGIRYVDDKLRTWFERWEASGFLDNSLVVITSDHGEGLGLRKDTIGNHGGFWQEGLHVPMLVQRRGVPMEPARVDTQVSILDATPTVMSFLGVDPDPRLSGADLLGELPAQRVVGAKQNQYTARIRGEAKLVRNAVGSVLFHLVNDPGELSPIANEGDAERLYGGPLENDYQAQLDAFGEVPQPREFTRSEYERLQLEALGYKD